MTPTQIDLHNKHKARLQRIAQAAARLNPKTDSEFSAALNTVEEPAEISPANKEPWFHILDSLDAIEDVRDLSITEIRSAVCRHFDLKLQELIARRRHARIVIPRQIGMYLCRSHTTKSYPEIGRMFGTFFDHTTVMHACRVIEKKMRLDWRIAYDVAHIEGLLA